VSPAPSVGATTTTTALSGPARIESAAPGGTTSLPGVASQLVSVIAPLRNSPGGTQSLTIALYPEGLGTVRATFTFDQQQLLVRLAPSSSAGESAIRAALPELHAGLSENSDRRPLVLVEPGSSGSQNGGNGSSPGQANTGSEQDAAGPAQRRNATAAEESTVSSAPLPNSSLLDLRL
jgi:flagellar hook-length control protein FliK